MKKLVLIIVAIMATTVVFSQAVQRNMVILEIATGTWCQYCPGAANGADELITNGCAIAVIENHNGDAFVNSYSNARNTYYNTPGYPDDHFDGIVTTGLGGAQCPNGTTYPAYLAKYNQRHAVPSPLTIDVSGTNAGNTYNLVLSIHRVATITATDLRAQVVLTETNISCAAWPPSFLCMTSVNFVERLMAPNESGTAFSFTSGDMQILQVSFTKNASWVNSNCEVVVFVQDNPSKEIFNGVKVPLNSIPAPVPVNFTSNTTTGCSPVTVNYTDQSSGVNTYQWDFPGGTPSSSTVQNPSITYNTSGTYDATLTAWNSTTFRGNMMIKPAYLNILSIPGVPGTPLGANQLCVNPPNQIYNADVAAGATSYTWDFQPPSAGVLTSSGNSCTIDFDNAYTGTASLKIKGTNSCGDGAWSPILSITVSTQPGVSGTPTGTTLLCMNPPNTDYQTSGAAPATSYVWELTPASAGSITGTWTTGTVDWGPTFVGTAQARVKAVNNGCEGPWSAYLNVTVDNGPGIFSMAGGGATCATGGTGAAVGLDGSQTGIDYTLYLNGTATTIVVPGTGGTITFGNQLIGGNYSSVGINPSTTCSNPMNGIVIVTVDPQVPDAPAQPTGNGAPTGGTTTDYTTSGGTYATSYSWNVTPFNAGTFTGSTTTGSITWSLTYQGPASIKVQGINACGAGSYSIDFPVNVVTGIAEPTKQKIVTLYPNPAKGIINIIPLFKMKTDLKVFNSLGCVIIEKNSLNLNGTYQLDISGLTPGIYYFNILTDDAQQIQKVIVE
jgi:PKD repeat protein